jgi:toxin ParE1/3/4
VRVRYSATARTDLETLLSYLSERSPQAARKMNAAIRETAASLGQNPRRGRLVRPTDVGEMRRLIVSPFVVFYEIEHGTVTIVRILHGARDLERTFPASPAEPGTQT